MHKVADVCFTPWLTLLSRFRHIAAFISAVEVNQRGFLPKRLRCASAIELCPLEFFNDQFFIAFTNFRQWYIHLASHWVPPSPYLCLVDFAKIPFYIIIFWSLFYFLQFLFDDLMDLYIVGNFISLPCEFVLCTTKLTAALVSWSIDRWMRQSMASTKGVRNVV